MAPAARALVARRRASGVAPGPNASVAEAAARATVSIRFPRARAPVERHSSVQKAKPGAGKATRAGASGRAGGAPPRRQEGEAGGGEGAARGGSGGPGLGASAGVAMAEARPVVVDAADGRPAARGPRGRAPEPRREQHRRYLGDAPFEAV